MNKTDERLSDLRLAAMLPNTAVGNVVKLVAPLLDRLLGLHKLRHLYDAHQLSGLDKQTFSQQLLKVLGVKVLGGDSLLTKIPEKGRCIVVCNHPYGMVEGRLIVAILK